MNSTATRKVSLATAKGTYDLYQSMAKNAAGVARAQGITETQVNERVAQYEAHLAAPKPHRAEDRASRQDQPAEGLHAEGDRHGQDPAEDQGHHDPGRDPRVLRQVRLQVRDQEPGRPLLRDRGVPGAPGREQEGRRLEGRRWPADPEEGRGQPVPLPPRQLQGRPDASRAEGRRCQGCLSRQGETGPLPPGRGPVRGLGPR